MAIEAIVSDVELAADEPFGERFFPLQHFFEWLEPNEFVFGLFAPELFGRTDGFIVEFAVFGQGFYRGAFGKIPGRVENAGLLKDRSDARGFVVYGHTISALFSAFYEEEAKRQL